MSLLNRKHNLKTKKIPAVPRVKIDRLEAGLSRELKNILYKVLDEAIDKLRPFTGKEAYLPINVDAIGDAYETDIFAAISKYKRRAAETAAIHVSNKLNVPFDKRYFNNKLLPVLNDRTFKIVTTKITKTISDDIKNAIQNGLKQGASAEQIIKHLDSLETNHRTIARTEINAAANDASFDVATKELSEIGLIGTAVKGWQTSNDEKVRDAHIEAGNSYGSGNEISVGDPFVVMGEEVMFPADYTHGSAGNIINCRCSYYILPAGNPAG